MRLDTNPVMLTMGRRISVGAIPIAQKRAPISTPTAAATQIPIVVGNPETRSPERRIAPVPRKPTPVTIAAGMRTASPRPSTRAASPRIEIEAAKEEGRPGGDQHVSTNAGRLIQHRSIKADTFAAPRLATSRRSIATGRRRRLVIGWVSPEVAAAGGHFIVWMQPPPRRRLKVRGALALERPLQQQHHLRFIQKAGPMQRIAGFG